MIKQFLFSLLIFQSMLTSVPNASAAQWIKKADITQSAIGRGAAQSFVLNNKMYVLGGYVGFSAGYTPDMMMYDPANDTWTSKTPPAEANRSAGIAFSIGNKAYVGLGSKNFLSFSPGATLLTDLNEYDATSNTWTSKASFPDSGRTGSAVFVLNNKAYVVGGKKGINAIECKDVWEYNPSSNTWTKKNDLPIGLTGAAGFATNSFGYIVGGIDESNSVTSATYEYHASADTWTLKGSFLGPVQSATAFVIGNYAYCGLGSDKDLGGSNALFSTSFAKFDLTNKIWSPTTYNFPNPGRLWPVSGVINGKAYAGAGYKFQSGEFAYKDLYELNLNPTDIAEVQDQNKWLIYPNPASKFIHLEYPGKAIKAELLDLSGRSLQNITFDHQCTWNLENYSVGSYILRLHTANGTILRKIEIFHE